MKTEQQNAVRLRKARPFFFNFTDSRSTLWSSFLANMRPAWLVLALVIVSQLYYGHW